MTTNDSHPGFRAGLNDVYGQEGKQMFGFDKPEDGSEERYHDRKTFWREVPSGPVLHYAWWIVHNLVSHPLIGVLPIKPFFKFHDWTSHKMNRGHDV